MRMKKLSVRRKNLRKRNKLIQEIRFAFEMQKTYPEDTLREIYKKLMEELIFLENNKGVLNVQTKKTD